MSNVRVEWHMFHVFTLYYSNRKTDRPGVNPNPKLFPEVLHCHYNQIT
jgi:hypothetical protein